jgi:hypothetical protein
LSLATSVTVDGGLAPAATPTLGFQPSIPPFSEAKMKAAGPEWPAASCTTKSFGFVSPLDTWPVGAPEAIVTIRPALLTVVAVPDV